MSDYQWRKIKSHAKRLGFLAVKDNHHGAHGYRLLHALDDGITFETLFLGSPNEIAEFLRNHQNVAPVAWPRSDNTRRQ